MKRRRMKYRHYPADKAVREYKERRGRRFKVTTINWTVATERGEPNYEKVHKNEYSWSLPYLIKGFEKPKKSGKTSSTLSRNESPIMPIPQPIPSHP